jgi:hypothetical protein
MNESNGREVSLRGGSQRRHTEKFDGDLAQIGPVLAIDQPVLVSHALKHLSRNKS